MRTEFNLAASAPRIDVDNRISLRYYYRIADALIKQEPRHISAGNSWKCMSVTRQCQHRGFHPHPELPGGGLIYERCADVYMNSKLKFEVVDLR